MSKSKEFLRLWLPVIAYAVLIFWISSLEQPFGIKYEIGYLDKLLHFLEYSVFGFLLVRAIYGSDIKTSGKIAILIAFLIGSLYGITDELHQSVVPGRFASMSDFIFDSLGSFFGAVMGTRHFLRGKSDVSPHGG